MELWHGSITDFVKESEAHALPGKMLRSFWNYHGHLPSSAETQSWDNSLPAFAAAIRNVPARDIGVVLEYHLPYSGYRVDACYLALIMPETTSL